MLKRAYEMSQTLADPATRAKAACAWARSVALDGDFAAARRLVDSGLALTSPDERFDGVVAGCLVDKGTIAMDEGDAAGVVAAGQDALERLRERPGAFPEIRASALQLAAVGSRMRGDAAEADRMFSRAMEQLRLIGREDSNDAAVLLHNWAINASLTNPLAALDLNRRVIDIFQGGGGPDSVPIPSRLNYGVMLNRLERYAEARAAHELVRALATKQGNTQSFGGSSQQLATACRRLGDLPCARDALRDAARAIPSSYPAGHRIFADLAREQALLAAAEGDTGDARPLLAEAIAIHRKVPQKHPSHVETLLEQARLELRLGRAGEAEAAGREALALAESFRGGATHSAYVGLSLLALGEIDQARGDDAKGRQRLTEAVAHMEPTLGGTHPAVVHAKARLAGRSDGRKRRSGGVRLPVHRGAGDRGEDRSHQLERGRLDPERHREEAERDELRGAGDGEREPGRHARHRGRPGPGPEARAHAGVEEERDQPAAELEDREVGEAAAVVLRRKDAKPVVDGPPVRVQQLLVQEAIGEEGDDGGHQAAGEDPAPVDPGHRWPPLS